MDQRGYWLNAFCNWGNYVHKVSVIVSTYNWPEALEMVLQSLIDQKDRNFEVIVADDGSGPETANTIIRMQKNHPCRSNISGKKIWAIACHVSAMVQSNSQRAILLFSPMVTVVFFLILSQTTEKLPNQAAS